MSEVVVPIRPGLAPAPPDGEVSPETVKVLEELLEKARSGEVSGIAYAVSHSGDTTSFHCVGYGGRALLGAVTLLQHNICKRDLEDR